MKELLEKMELNKQVSENCLKKVKTEKQKEYFQGQLDAFTEIVDLLKKRMGKK